MIIEQKDVDNFLDELIKVNENSSGPTLSEFCGQLENESTDLYSFRYSFASVWISDVIVYSKELTTEKVRKFLMMLPPFKDNWTTEYETKFIDQIDSYAVDENFVISKDYVNDGEDLFLKIEDENGDNHWCFVRKVEMI